MTSYQKRLNNVTELTVETCQYLQKHLIRELKEIGVPDEWEIDDADVEETIDNSGDWIILSLSNNSEREYAELYVLPGSNAMQLYFSEKGEWTNPTHYPEDLINEIRSV